MVALAATTSSGASAPAIQGDANCDGLVEAVDGLPILYDVAGLGDGGCVEANGDTDCSGSIESRDVTGVLLYSAGAVPALDGDCPAVGSPLSTPLPSSVVPTPVSETPTPTSSPTPTPTPTLSPTPKPTITLTPTRTPTPTPTPTCGALPAAGSQAQAGGATPEAGGYHMTRLPADAEMDKLTDLAPVPGDPGLAVVTTENGMVWSVCLINDDPRQLVGDLSGMVRDFNGSHDSDEGLVAIAFDPIDPTYVYLDYSMGTSYLGASPTANTVRSRISRFHLVNGQIDLDSEEVIIDIYQPWEWHNGDGLVFGPDGMLYIGSGDGGLVSAKGQTLDDLWGAILRIDVHGATPYAIPPDNPFVAVPSARPEVWAYGFRNPWRFAFDGNQMWVADVGENTFEEVNRGEAGTNFGWNVMEGPQCYQPTGKTATPGPTCNPADFATPRAYYGHVSGNGCAIIGGHVYHGAAMPELDGYFVYGDFCSGRVWAVDTSSDTSPSILLTDSNLQIESWAVTHEGEIVALSYRADKNPGEATPGVYLLQRSP